MPFFDVDEKQPQAKSGKFFDVGEKVEMLSSHKPNSIVPPEPPSTFDKIKKGAAKVLDTAVDEARTVGDLLATPVKQAGSGLGALAVGADTLIRGGSFDDAINNASQSIQDINERMTYTPQTAVGKGVQKVVSYPFEKLHESSQADIERRQEARGVNPLDLARGIANELIPFAIGTEGKVPVANRPVIPEEIRMARSVEGAVPVGDTPVQTPPKPNRFNQEPVVNDMPQQPLMLPEPERYTQKRADIEVASNDLAAQIAEAKEQPSGWANHENLAGDTVITARDSMTVAPEKKPVVKGTVSEVQEMGKTGELNPREHQVFYPDGKSNPNGVAYVIRKAGIDRPIEAVKKELRMGGDAESRWLGFPERESVPPGERATAAVTKQGEVVTEPARIVEESANKNLQWSAEGEPTEVVAKANEIATGSKEPTHTVEVYNKESGEKLSVPIRAKSEVEAKQLAKEVAAQNGTRAFNLEKVGDSINPIEKTSPESNLEAVEGVSKEGDLTFANRFVDHRALVTNKELITEKFNKLGVVSKQPVRRIQVKLRDLITHDRLFDEFPEMGDVEVVINKEASKRNPGTLGLALPSENRIILNRFDDLVSRKDFNRTLVHEIHHFLQEKSKVELSRDMSEMEAHSVDTLYRHSGPVDLYAGLHPKEIGRAVKATYDLASDIVPPTWQDRITNFISLPQRIAASGKYPSFSKAYEKYRTWEESRNAITSDLYNTVDAKRMRELQNNMSAAEKAELRQVLKKGELDKRFFEKEDLLSERNPLGRPVSEKVADAYKSIRDLIFNTAMEDFRQTVDTALHAYNEKPWYNSLKEWFDEGLTSEEISSFANDYGKLVDREALDALDTVNEVKRYIEEEVMPNYQLNPEYIPHVRPDGDFRVVVYELEADGTRGREIYMRPSFNTLTAKRLVKKLSKNPAHEEFGFPENYNRIKALEGVEKLEEGKHYEIKIESNKNRVDEEVWKYTGSMSAKQAELNNVLAEAARSGKIKAGDFNGIKSSIDKVLLKRQLSRGYGRHKIARQDHLIEGYDITDPVGLALNYAKNMAGFHSKSRYAMDVAKLFKDAPTSEHYLMNEFIQDSLANSNSSMVKAGALVRQNLVLTQLAYRAIAPMINYTQNYVWAAPELASLFEKSGIKGKNALVEIKKAQGEILRQKYHDVRGTGKEVHTPIMKQALEAFDRTGAAEAQTVREVSGLGKGAHIRGLTRATELGMKPFSFVETALNREANFAAAFKNFMENGMTYEEAFAKAKDFSLNVNIDASTHNYPGIVRKTGEVGKTAYTFGRYGHSYISWLFDKAIRHQEFKPVIRSMVVLGALGGTMGLPFVNEMDKFLERFAGKSPKLALRNAIKERVRDYGMEDANGFIEDLVLNGIPAALFDINISRSVAPSLPIISEVVASGDIGKAMGGVVGASVVRAGRSIDAFGRGDTLRGVENFPLLPQGAANFVNAYRQNTEGVTTASGGIVEGTAGEPLKMSTGEALTKAVLGANPQRVAREQDIRDSVLTMQKTYEDRINNLKERVKRGKQGWTPEFNKEFYQLKEQIRKYNLPIKATKQLRRPRVDRRYKSSIKTYDYISGGE